MVEEPADLVGGRGDPRADAITAVAAVARYHSGKVKPLPDSGVAEVKPVSSGGGTAALSGGDS